MKRILSLLFALLLLAGCAEIPAPEPIVQTTDAPKTAEIEDEITLVTPVTELRMVRETVRGG